MGACCSVLNQDNGRGSASSRVDGLKFSNRREQSANRLGNKNSSPNQGLRGIEQTRDRQQTTPNKIVPIRNQEHQSAVTDVIKTRGGEPSHNPSVDYKVEFLDACEESTIGESLLPLTNDDDFCPTCLDGYDENNPKINTQCKHHYHLSCILEWMERSNTCPICDQEMAFEERY